MDKEKCEKEGKWTTFLALHFYQLFVLCLPLIMVTSPGCVCTTTSSQLAMGRRPEVAAARLFTLASLSILDVGVLARGLITSLGNIPMDY